MNYEAIETRIKALIEAAKIKPITRIDAALEPIRESLLEARRAGVRLNALYEVVLAEAKEISVSSFARYARHHLQVRKQRGKRAASHSTSPPKTPKQIHVEKKIQDEPKQPRPQAGKPRIATGNY
jgi:hypothetical protein